MATPAALANLVRMTTATTGTGTVTLGAAVSGFKAFPAGLNGLTVTYAIQDGSNSEIGRGVYTHSGTTLTRAVILASTNSDNAINLSGSAQVFISPAAEDLPLASNVGFNDLSALRDDSLNEILVLGKTATAVNEVKITNAATAGKPLVSATGGDTDIILRLNGKGTGGVETEGTATNDDATAGYVGEYISSRVLDGAPVALVTATAKTITSITLTPGDWDLQGVAQTVGVGSPTTTVLLVDINTTTDTLPADGGLMFQHRGSTVSNLGGPTFTQRVSIASNTTYYLVGLAVFTGGSSLSAYGMIGARRVR